MFSNRFRRSMQLATVAGLALAAAACGGGGNNGSGDGLTDAQREDRAASASIAGLFAFAVAQIARSTDDTVEPRSIGGITAPASDADEPFVLQ